MTAHISRLLQPVDQEKLPAPMSHFDSPAEAPALAFGCQHRVEKTKAKLARDRENRHIDPGHPTKLKLKTQKTTSAERAIFFIFFALLGRPLPAVAFR